MRVALPLLSIIALSAGVAPTVFAHTSVPHKHEAASNKVTIWNGRITTAGAKHKSSSRYRNRRLSAATRERLESLLEKRRQQFSQARAITRGTTVHAHVLMPQRRTAPTLVTSNHQKINGVYPIFARDGIQPKHQKLLSMGYEFIPDQCKSTLRSPNVRYDNPKHRGLAGEHSMYLAGHVPDPEFLALFFHEYGHIIDLGCLRGDPSAGASLFKDHHKTIWNNDPSISFYQISWQTHEKKVLGAVKEDFVSGYASWNPFEDFSESWLYYAFHRTEFKRRAQTNAALAAKYRWFEQQFPNLPEVARSASEWDGAVPWDITKLAFVWLHPQTVALR